MSRWLFVFLIPICWPTAASALTDCVYNSSEFQEALSLAETDGVSATIYLHTGSYEGNFHIALPVGKSLHIRGGFENCASAASAVSAASKTKITGYGGRVLQIDTSAGGAGEIRIEGVRLTGGNGSQTGGGLLIYGGFPGTYSGDIVLDRVIVDNSFGSIFGGGIFAWTEGGLIKISNSWIHDNSSGADGGGIVLSTSGYSYLYNNTIVRNTVGGATSGGVLGWFHNMKGEFANNIIWGNTANDAVDIDYGHISHRMFRNDIGVSSGDIGAGSAYNLSVDPGFLNVSGSMWRDLWVTSPLIDIGSDIGYAYDADANPRKVGPYVDIGAFEFQYSVGNVLFIDGFDDPD